MQLRRLIIGKMHNENNMILRQPRKAHPPARAASRQRPPNGIARATTKISLANLVFDIKRLPILRRLAVATNPKAHPRKPITPSLARSQGQSPPARRNSTSSSPGRSRDVVKEPPDFLLFDRSASLSGSFQEKSFNEKPASGGRPRVNPTYPRCQR